MKTIGRSTAVLSATLLLVTSTAAGGPKEFWSDFPDFGEGDYSSGVRMNSKGEVYNLWRISTNSFLVKSTIGGAVVWSHKLTGEISHLSLDRAGNAFIAGGARYSDAGEIRSELYVAKLSAGSGSVLWEERFRTGEPADTRAQNLVIDPAGNPVLLASIESGTATDALVLEYLSTDGTIQWQRRIDSLKNPSGPAVALAGGIDGDVAIAGTINNDMYAAKINGSNGDVRWSTMVTHTNLYVFVPDLAVDPQGNVAITAATTWAVRTGDMYTAKFASSNGDLMWGRWHSGPGSTQNHAGGIRVLPCENGDILAIGNQSRLGGGSPDIYLARYKSTNGDVVWENTYGIATINPQGVVEDEVHLLSAYDENFILGLGAAGYTLNSSRSSTSKIDGDTGNIIWEIVHTNRYVNAFAFTPQQQLTISGQLRPDPSSSKTDAFSAFFRAGPEVTIQLKTDSKVEIEWSGEYLGWTLHKSVISGGLEQWLAISGSSESTKVSIPLNENSSGIYQLLPSN